MWLYIALAGYACLAIVALLDKYILSEEKVEPIIFVFYSTVFLLPLGFALPFVSLSGLTWPVAIVAASAAGLFAASLGTMYLAFRVTEVSHTGPFIGALIPLFILVLGGLFLGESVTDRQLMGIFLLSIGSLFISYQKSPSHKRWSYHINPAVVSALFFALSYIAAKFTYTSLSFIPGFVLIWSIMGVIGLGIGIFSKKVHEHFFPKHPIVAYLKSHVHLHGRPHHEVAAVVADKALGAVGTILVQYAVSLGSVTAVNALSGVQYGLVVLIVAASSVVAPHIFKEKYQKGELAIEFVAVLVISIGIAFLV